jgi:hypothetical protein
MNDDLTQLLLRRFPVLYQDYYSPMRHSCMCWGFDHGDGWFEIIWQLSLAIEEELNYSWLEKQVFLFKKGFFRRWNKSIYRLSPVRLDKTREEGAGTKEDPKRVVLVEKAPVDRLARLALALFPPHRSNDFRSWTAKLQRLGFKAFVRWPNTGFAVVQVKEKYGTLRFYCPATAAIDKYVCLAERLSSITCENCGKRGTPDESGWVRTLCDACRNQLGSCESLN